MQRIVDRRFNRPRHAADEVLADMADRVRDPVDPSLIVGALATAANETLEPARTAVWIRRSPAPVSSDR